jgi:uncharacterized protein (UPF0264 family)
MRLLVSIERINELKDVMQSNVSIIDVKNLKEGAIGANLPWIIKDIVRTVNGKFEVSATIGDLPYLVGTSSLAAYAASSLGVNYVKAGLKGVRSEEEAKDMILNLSKAAKQAGNAKLICVSYADYLQLNSISPLSLAKIAKDYGADGVMIDVYNKRLGSLLDLLDFEYIKRFIRIAKMSRLIVGLAGGIGKEVLGKICSLEPDVIGVRRAVCVVKDRELKVSREKVRELANMVNSLNSNCL